MKKLFAQEHQRQIFVKGLSGEKPIIPTDVNELIFQAKAKIPKEAFEYIATGAGAEHTMRQNESAFQQWKIIPRWLRDVSERDLSSQLFNQTFPAPILLSPIGVLEMVHPKGDLELARAAKKLGIPMVFSNQASYPMEACANVLGDSPHWFQLYWSKNNDLVASFVERAEKCACSAIVVTLDTFMLGWRTRDIDTAYLPFLEGKGIAQYTSDPVFNAMLDANSLAASNVKPTVNLTSISKILALNWRHPGSFFQNLRSKRPLTSVRQFINTFSRDTLTWDDLQFLRKHTKLPILLKGILHPDDAIKAMDYGMDGIVVSNHGGRQIDGSVAAIDALPAVVRAVNGKIPIVFDSGIRSGADIFKALALGANTVGIGRTYAYALALAGERGVEAHVLNLLSELEITMSLAGCKSVDEINPSYLMR